MDTLTYGALAGKVNSIESEIDHISAIKWLGVTTTPLTDGDTTKPIIIDGVEVRQKKGDMVSYNEIEFVWNGSKWQEFGRGGYVPSSTSSDEGKVLMVNSNGAPVWTALPSALGVNF